MRYQLKILISLILPAILFSAALVFAADFSSANFISRDPIMSDFGSRSTSTSFEQLNAGGQTVIGESTSTNFILRSGFLYFEEKFFIPKSKNWRWYDDETNETPAVSLAAENVAPTDIVNQNIIKLRLSIAETANVSGANIKFKLQFSEYSDFSQDVNDVVEIGSCAANSLWCYGNGIDSDNAPVTARVLTDSTLSGIHNESGISTSTFDPPANTAVEYEFTIKHAGARVNTVYFFRAFNTLNNAPVPLNQNSTYPSLVTEAAKLTLSINGLPSGTATEGIVTDAPTAPLNISFGPLSPGSETEVAQRLIVTTNGTDGYRIFMFQRQELLGDGGSEIASISGNNEVPLNWPVACASLDLGCYGYHSGDDTLSGNAGRFTANDTYARLENAPKEVAFSSVPVTDELVDIIFKAQIGQEQPAENYQSSVGYIIIPTF